MTCLNYLWEKIYIRIKEKGKKSEMKTKLNRKSFELSSWPNKHIVVNFYKTLIFRNEIECINAFPSKFVFYSNGFEVYFYFALTEWINHNKKVHIFLYLVKLLFNISNEISIRLNPQIYIIAKC